MGLISFAESTRRREKIIDFFDVHSGNISNSGESGHRIWFPF